MKTNRGIKNYFIQKRNSNIRNIFGFSLVELLVSISILATISIVAYVSYGSHLKTSYNAIRIETIDALHLSLSDYHQIRKILPDPKSNYISYDDHGTYTHSLSGAYGVSGFVSHDFLPAGYVNFGATDPENNQFYGYGKLIDNTSFDVAAALYDEKTGGYKTYIRGTYQKYQLSSLIRSYSSSNFVSQDSFEELPYNPYERKVSAIVSSYSGTIEVQDSKGNILSNTGELNSGDILIVATGSTALLHISDGSELSLGDSTTETKLVLSSLSYSDDNNLVSQVLLYLQSGEVWTEAPHYRAEVDSVSDFSIKTDSALAAVRGTVFGISKNISGTTEISLVSGKLEVEKLVNETKTPFTEGFTTTTSTGFITENNKSYMVVKDGEQPIILGDIADTTGSANGASNIPTTTILDPLIDSVKKTEIQKKIQHPPFSLGYKPKITSVSFTGSAISGTISTGTLTVKFYNPGADSYELSFGTETDFDNKIISPIKNTLSSSPGPVTITGSFAMNSLSTIERVFMLRICFQGKCSAPEIKTLVGNSFSFDSFRIGEPKCSDDTIFWGSLVGTREAVCQKKNLVAFALYDPNRNDQRLYTRTGTIEQFRYSSIGDGSGLLANFFPGESLKYDITPLQLTGSFSIEMSVPGSALKRTSGTYYLFSSPLSKPYLDIYFGNLIFGSGINKISLLVSSYSGLLQDNAFYTVVAKSNNGQVYLGILDQNRMEITHTGGTIPAMLLGTPIYIGSSASASSQWNDIIDSVKIYNQ